MKSFNPIHLLGAGPHQRGLRFTPPRGCPDLWQPALRGGFGRDGSGDHPHF
jgi:hypothetical protein